MFNKINRSWWENCFPLIFFFCDLIIFYFLLQSLRDAKLKGFGRNDENVFNQTKCGKILEPTIQLEQFQGFSVYKDDSSNENIPPPEEEDENVGETSAMR